MNMAISAIQYGILEGLVRWLIGLVLMVPLNKKRMFRLRAIAMLPVAMLLDGTLYMMPPSNIRELLVPVVGLIFYLIMGTFLIDEWFTKVFYFSVWSVFGYTVLYELWQFMIYYFYEEWSEMGYTLSRVTVWWCILVVFVLGLFFAFAVHGMIAYRMDHIGPRQTSSAVLIYLVFVGLSFPLYNKGYFDPRGYLCYILVLFQFICVIVCYLQSALFRNSALKQELDAMHLLWNQQHTQYEKSKENIAVINQKCHDLKHQIAAMRTMENSEEREKYIREIQDSVNFYDAVVKTGNDTLDTVLTEKSLLCRSRGIDIHCVADGKVMDFMNPVDIYTLMGNALDNAIEAVSQLKEVELRIIDVLVYVRNQLIIITVVNPMSGQLEFKDGIPLTTKRDQNYHGFGVFSMRTTVHKYGGEISLTAKDGLFEVKILLPLKQKGEAADQTAK